MKVVNFANCLGCDAISKTCFKVWYISITHSKVSSEEGGETRGRGPLDELTSAMSGARGKAATKRTV